MPWDDSEFRRQLEGMSDADISLALVKREGEFDRQNRRDLAEWVLRSRESERRRAQESASTLRANVALIVAAISAIISIISKCTGGPG